MSLNQTMQSNLTDLNRNFSNQISDINDDDLPEVLVGQLTKLKNLEKLSRDSKNAAKEAQRKAEEAKEIAVGWFNKKGRIEDLQQICLDLSQALQILTETQEASFRHQSQLAQISKYLFRLGAGNISANRTVVRELELRLKGASEEELSELAKQELKTVVKQLKAQEDVIKKQEKFTKLINKQDHDITELFDKNIEVDEKISLQSYKIIAGIKEVNEKILLSEKEFGNRIEKLSDNFNLEISGSNFKILKVKEELKSVAQEANIKAEKIEKDLKSEIESIRHSMEKNDKIFIKILNSQKIRINLLTAFLILNIILFFILAFYSIKP